MPPLSPHPRRMLHLPGASPLAPRAALGLPASGSLLALPSLLIALLLWWSAGKTWDAREHWSGIWLLAVVCGAVYRGLLWLGHGLPSLAQAVALGLLRHDLAGSAGHLREFLGGDLYEWVYGNELCIRRAELARPMVVVGEPGYGKVRRMTA